jgi:hypothetical protein
MMKKYPLFLILLFLVGCKEISFREPQPKGKDSLTKVPAALHGSYLIRDDNGTPKDTLSIDANGYKVGHNPNEKAVLSDSLVLKLYKGYYFVNLNERPEWVLRVLRKQKNGDLLFMAMESDDKRSFNLLMTSLSKEIKIDSTEVNGSMLYQIDPNPKQLVSLITKGYFKKTVLTKMK